MSLTESSEVYVAVEESALNDFITAVCTTRPHLLHYGSPAFVPANSVSSTQMSPIPFPGSPGLQWSVELAVPTLDLYTQDRPLPPELSLGPGQFSVSTSVVLCVDCAARGKGDQKPDNPKGSARWPDDRDDWGIAQSPVCCKLGAFAIGHLVSTWTAGQEAIGLAVDSVEIVDIEPNALESVLECLLLMILRTVLATMSLPVSALDLGAFTLTPTEGPLIDVNQVLARGDF